MSKFKVKTKPGENLAFFNNIRNFYLQNKGIYIVKYDCAKVSQPRTLDSIQRLGGSLPRCSLCRLELYRLEPSLDGGQVMATIKTHMVLTDNNGKQYLTCRGIGRCMQKQGWDKDWKDSRAEAPPYKAPTMDEFIDITKPGSDPDSFLETMRREEVNKLFNEIVLPFLEKWYIFPLDKTNYRDFVSDLNSLDKFTIYLFPNAQDIFIKRVFNFIGIT